MSASPRTSAKTSSRASFSDSLSTRALWLTWLSWAVLVLQQALDSGLQHAPWFIWVVKVVPLLLFVRGMLRDNLRSFIWLCFVCLGYFMLLVQRMFMQPQSPLVIVGMTAVVVLFTAAMLYVRWRARELRARQAPQLDTGESGS